MKKLLLILLTLTLFAGFCALGAWQVQRRAWKLDLIAQVDTRVHQPPVDAPALPDWPGLTSTNAEYRHVHIQGTLHPELATFVQAATDYGSGYWVMTPLALDGGGVVLVNRGFVLPEWRKLPPQPPGPANFTGLLRMSEPTSAFLRDNDPARDIWYLRNTAQIAQARALNQYGAAAPYFIDAEALTRAAPNPALQPVAGLTVIQFPNNHLQYALTWFALALLTLAGAAIVWRKGKQD